MKYLLSAAALLATTVVADKRDLCSDGSTDDNGNWYCQEVQAITYTGVGGDSSYNKVTSMPDNGVCSSEPQPYSGTLSPLDEGVSQIAFHDPSIFAAPTRGKVSLHFRGPLQLKQFAVYTPSSSSSKKTRRHEERHAHAHGHAHLHHAREAHDEKRALGDMVTATINGVVQTWANDWSGEPTSAAQASSATSATSTVTVEYASSFPAAAENYAAPSSVDTASYSASSAAASSSPSSESSGSISSSSGGWGRQAYYDSSSGFANGLTFLNHYGGSGSGVFDYTYGSSLSYASSDGTTGTSEPKVLSDTTLASGDEVVIMSSSKCGDDGVDCGFVRPGTVAYQGFTGSEKAFFFEFGMPDDGQTSASEYDPVNMPAIWMLNQQIPNTLQYGPAPCSCWTSGCGEFDIFEVLAPGDTRCKSTLHGNVQGGDSDYFARPTSGTIKAALVMYDNNIHIKILDNNTHFGSSMDAGTINDICGSTLTQNKFVSLFPLAPGS